MQNEERMNRLEQRIRELENEVKILKETINQTKSTPHSVTFDSQFKASTASKVDLPENITESEKKIFVSDKSWELLKKGQQKEKLDLEKLLTQIWLPRIFMVVMLLGVIWGFKVAIDYGFLTPPVRIIIGFVAGAVLVYLGQRQLKYSREKLGIVLLGGSYSVLLFTTYAANTLFGYFHSSFAFLLNIIWLALGLFLAHKHHSQALGIFIAIGGYFIPFLIKSADPSIWFFTGYETLLFLLLLYFSMRKSFIGLYFTAFILLHATFFIYMLATLTADLSRNEPLVYGVVAQFLLITITFLRSNLYIKQQMTALFTSFVLTSGWVHLVLEKNIAEQFSLMTTIVFIGISLFFLKKDKDRMVTASIVSAFSLIIWFFHMIDGDELLALLLLEGTALLYLGWYLQSTLQKLCGSFIYGLSFIIGLQFSLERLVSTDSLIWLTLILTTGLVFYGVLKYEKEARTQKWLLVGMNVVVWLRYTLLVTPLLLGGVDENVIQMAVSFEWAMLAVCVVVFGIRRNKQAVRLTGVGILFIALFKVIFFDLFMVSITVRAVLFIGLGVIGIIISRIFYSRNEQ